MKNSKVRKPDIEALDVASVRKLQFFDDFLALEGLTHDNVAKMLSFTRPTVTHWFKTDDISFSWQHRIAKVLDLSIRITIVKNITWRKEEPRTVALPVVPLGKKRVAPVPEPKPRRFYSVSISRETTVEL